MSLNQTFSHHKPSRLKIDFAINESYSTTDFSNGNNSKSIGKLTVGNTEIQMSSKEIDILIDTLTSAKEVIYKKFKMKLL